MTKRLRELRQEVFDKIWAGAKAQGFERSIRKSKFDGGAEQCLYRGPNDCKCNVGHLIPDDRYHFAIEGRAINSIEVYNRTIIPDLIKDSVMEERSLRMTDGVISFLQRAQSAHDEALNAAEHEERLRALAVDYNLEIPA